MKNRLAARIADLGCGCGSMLSVLSEDYDVVGVDGSEQAIEFCEQRQVRAQLGFLPDQVPLPRESFDAVLLLDVLEHLDEDQAAVSTASSLLRPGGIMICTVPAYQWLYSPRDAHHHHRRRYSKKQFADLFDRPELEPEILSHYNTWLFPLAAAARLSTRMMKPKEATTDLHVPPRPVNGALRRLFASERAVLGRVSLPYGLSLVSVARKR